MSTKFNSGNNYCLPTAKAVNSYTASLHSDSFRSNKIIDVQPLREIRVRKIRLDNEKHHTTGEKLCKIRTQDLWPHLSLYKPHQPEMSQAWIKLIRLTFPSIENDGSVIGVVFCVIVPFRQLDKVSARRNGKSATTGKFFRCLKITADHDLLINPLLSIFHGTAIIWGRICRHIGVSK